MRAQPASHYRSAIADGRDPPIGSLFPPNSPPLLCARVSLPVSSPSLSRPRVDSSSPQCRHLCAYPLASSRHPLVQHGVLSTLSYALHLSSRCVGGMPVPTARWCGPRAVRFADRAVGAKSASSRPGRSHPFAVDAALASPRTPRGHIVPHPPV
jgi:hypothetical protein